ncbi:TPA: hypothetical protein RI785_002308 [Vibrio cholerae]|nr:hypothetical protein [Vibrio cholerae]
MNEIKRKSEKKLAQKLLEQAGVDLSFLPKKHLKSITCHISHNGIQSYYEFGFYLDENIKKLKEFIGIFHPIKVVTSKAELFQLRLMTGDEHVPFTHINQYYEDNIFVCIYAIPIQLVNALEDKIKQEKMNSV